MAKGVNVSSIIYDGFVPEGFLCPTIIQLLKDGKAVNCECGRRVELDKSESETNVVVGPFGGRRGNCEAISFFSQTINE